MTNTPAVPENPCHVRSISMPTRSHPLVVAVEEEIRKLEAWKTPSKCPSPLTAEMICNGLNGLKCAYDSMEDLLQLPIALHQNEKWVGDVLDGSVRLLDICSTTRDILLQTNQQVKDLRSALRRSGESGMKNRVEVYVSSTKKVKKDISKCICVLRQMDNKCTSAPLVYQDQHLSTVARLLREIRIITTSFFQTILSFVSASRPKPRTSKWSLVSRSMHKGKVASADEDQNDMNEAERVDVALSALRGCSLAKEDEMERVHRARKQLEAFEVCIEGLEGGLECMFRCLIQNRVSLLNILTH